MKRYLIRVISLIILVCFLTVGLCAPVYQAQAFGFWGDAIPAAILKEKLEEIYEYVKVSIVASMQNAAMRVLYTQMQRVIGKTGIITDFHTNIFTDSSKTAETYTKDLITNTLRGSGSQNFVSWEATSGSSESSNWTTTNNSTGTTTTVKGGDSCSWKNPDTGETVNSCGSYASTLQTAAENALTKTGLGEYDVPEFCADANNTFSSSNSGYGWSCFLSQLEWNPIKISLDTQSTFNAYKTELQTSKQTQAVAYQGFNPKIVDGKIVVPGSTLEQMMSNVLDIPNKIISTVEHPAQLGIILSGFMQQLVNEVTNYGFSLVRQQIDNQVNKLENNINKALNTKTSVSGPQTIYKSNY